MQKKWIPILDGCWKLSCDASWNTDRKCGGVGWALRDWKGALVAADLIRVHLAWDISWLEALAISEGHWEIPSSHNGSETFRGK